MSNFINWAKTQDNFLGLSNRSSLRLWFIRKDSYRVSGFVIYAHYQAGSSVCNYQDAGECVKYWKDYGFYPEMVEKAEKFTDVNK